MRLDGIDIIEYDQHWWTEPEPGRRVLICNCTIHFTHTYYPVVNHRQQKTLSYSGKLGYRGAEATLSVPVGARPDELITLIQRRLHRSRSQSAKLIGALLYIDRAWKSRLLDVALAFSSLKSGGSGG